MTELRRVAVTIKQVRAVIDVAAEVPEAVTRRLAEILPYTTERQYAKISGQGAQFRASQIIRPGTATARCSIFAGRLLGITPRLVECSDHRWGSPGAVGCVNG